MIQKNIVKQPKSVVEVQITVPWEDLAPKWQETLQRLAQDVEIPGFRKGSAPLPMIETNLGGKLQDELLKTAMPQFLVQALQGTGIVPIDYPRYDLTSFTKGQPLQFKAVVTNRPEVKVGDFKSIKVTRPAGKQVTDEEVNKVVDDLFKRWKASPAAMQPKAQQPTGAGPAGSISFNNTNDAQPTPAESSTAPDDNFAKAMGATNLEDLKARITKDLHDNANYNNELDYEEAILQEVEKMTQVELPDVLIQDELNRMLVSLQRRVADMGMLLEDYLRGQGKTLEQLKNEWKPQADKNVRMELGLAEIARQEGVNISDEELQAEIDKIQDNRIKQQFTQQEPRMHLRHSLRQVKTLDLLKKLVS